MRKFKETNRPVPVSKHVIDNTNTMPPSNMMKTIKLHVITSSQNLKDSSLTNDRISEKNITDNPSYLPLLYLS